jgi:hypothetical protein
MIDKKIQEQIALRKLTILKGFKEVEEVTKGHMDFGDQRPDASSGGGGGKQGLVKKQITDKMGRKTSRWVRQGEDEKGSKDSSKPEEQEDKKEVGTKPGEEGKQEVEKYAKDSNLEKLANHASKTESSVLMKFVDGDDEMAQAAREELQKRGELDGDYEEPMDYDNPDSVKFALDAHADKDAIIDFAITHGVPIGQAMKLHDATKQDNSETHAAIDEAQNSLNSLKEKTGHPETQQRNEDDGGDFSGDDSDVDAMIDDLAEGIFNSQGKMDTAELFKKYMALKDLGMSDKDIEDKVAPSAWEFPNMSDEEKEGMKEDWDYAMEAILGEDRASSNDSEEDDFINPGNTKEQAQDRASFNDSEETEQESADNKVDSKESQKDFSNGDDFFDAYYQMYEEGGDGFVEDINDYIMENDLGMDGRDQEQEFNSLSPKHKKTLVAMMKEAFDSFTRYQKGQ